MSFRVSRQYSDLPCDIITGGCREKERERKRDMHGVRRERVVEVSAGDEKTGRTIREGGGRGDGRFILLNVKFHVGTQLLERREFILRHLINSRAAINSV